MRDHAQTMPAEGPVREGDDDEPGGLVCGHDGGGGAGAAALGCEVAVEVERSGGGVECGLGAGEEVLRVAVGEVADGDLGIFDGVVFAAVEGVAKVLEEGERAFGARGVAGVADDGVDGAMGAGAVDEDEVA